MWLVSSFFNLEYWPESQKSSKLSRKFLFYVDMNACAFWRALRAVLSTPFGYKLQTIWAICGRARGFRTQECARSCDMSTNEIFDKIKYFLTSWLSSYLENSLLSLKKASFFGGGGKKKRLAKLSETYFNLFWGGGTGTFRLRVEEK